MRAVSLAALCAFLCALPAFGQQVGERIIVKSDVAELRSEKQTTGRVAKGETLRVEKVNGEWLWVIAEQQRETVRGWIHRKDVIPFSQGLELFNEEVRRQPTAASYLRRGHFLRVQGNHDKAIDDFNEAFRLDPKFAGVHGYLGLAYFEKGDYDAAIAELSELIGVEPDNGLARRIRGQAWAAKQSHDKAIVDFNEALRVDPQNSDSYNLRGWAWQAKGEQDKAIADFNEVVRLNPSSYSAFLNRGHAWHKKGEYDKAIADFTEALRLKPNDWDGHGARAYAGKLAGRYAEAIADNQHLVHLRPDLTGGYTGLAEIYASCPDARYRDGRKAVEAATKACELSKWKEFISLDALAMAYAESGDFKKAVEWGEKAAAVAPDYIPMSVKADLRARIELYKSGKPFRDDPKKK